MRKILKLLKSEEMWVVLTMVLGLGICLSLFVNEMQQGKNLPKDRFQTFEHNYLPDFNAYLSKMTEGGKGEVLVYERMTNEPHEPSLLQIFYLILGKIGIGILGLRVDFAYHFWRFVLAGVRLFVGYLFILAVLPGREKKLLRILALVLYIFSGDFPFKVINQQEFGVPIMGVKFRLVFDQWSNLDPLQRLAYIPHWMAGQAGIAVSLILFIRAKLLAIEEKIHPKLFFIGALMGLVSGFVLPSAPIVLIVVLLLYLFLLLITGRFKKLKEVILPIAIGSIIMGIPLIYVKWVTQFFPWKALALADKEPYILHFPWGQYFMGLGVTGYLGVAGGALVLIKAILTRLRMNFLLPAVLWGGVSLGFIWVFDTFLKYDQRRFVQTGVELPLAILTVVLIDWVAGRVLKIVKLIKFKNAGVVFVCALILISSVFVWYISYVSRVIFVRDRVWASMPLVSVSPYVVYQPKDWMEGIFWLSKNTTVNDVVFSDYVAGNYIAAYAGNRVYVGHGAQTVDYKSKLGLVKSFFEGKMREDEVLLFLKENYVKYVFAGPQEMDYGGGFLKYTFLKPIYTANSTKIYKLKN